MSGSDQLCDGICKFGQHDTYTGTWRARQTSLQASGQKSLDFIGCWNLPLRLTPLQNNYKLITTASWSITCPLGPSWPILSPSNKTIGKTPGILIIFEHLLWGICHLSSPKLPCTSRPSAGICPGRQPASFFWMCRYAEKTIENPKSLKGVK